MSSVKIDRQLLTEEVECEICGEIITIDRNGDWFCEICD
jgi:hypothetical protein